MMTKRVALYLRVSTDGQTTQNQRLELEKVAQHRGWTVSAVYEDQGVSGAKGRSHRNQYDQLLKDATRGRFDFVAAWSGDRLGRSLQDLVAFLDELQSVKCDLYLNQQAIDTTTPAGRAMFQMCGVVAEFERTMIQARVKAGLQRARAKGTRLGRPTLSDWKKAKVLEAKSKGMSDRRIAAEYSVTVRKVHAILKEAGKPPP